MDESDDEETVSESDSEEADSNMRELYEASYIINLKTGLFHAKSDDDFTRVKCGNMPIHAAPAYFAAVMADGRSLCARCFG